MNLFLLLTMFSIQSAESWTPVKLQEALKRGITNTQETEIQQWFGGDERLKRGSDPKVDDLKVAWAIRVPEGTKTVSVKSEDASNFVDMPGVQRPKPFDIELRKIGTQGLYAGTSTLNEGESFRWRYVVDMKPVGNPRDIECYTMPPESKSDPSVSAGSLEAQPQLESKVFGGTRHDWWVYTPSGFDASKESNLVIFQDGQWSHNYVPVYFDHLIAKGELPQTVVVFVTPGTFPDGKSDRSREYDTLNDSYTRFLLEELLRIVQAKFKITENPMKRCVAGLSSGGICAFTVAWQRPDKFGLVLSWIGSFANIASGDSSREGGHNYPALIRKSPKRSIRVFLQDGGNDLDNAHGNWPLSNLAMAKALEFSKYEFRSVWGQGFHSDKQGRATLADSLRWLFSP